MSVAMGAVYFTCAASVNYVLFLAFSESAAAATQCGGCWCQLRWKQFTCAAGVKCVLFHAFSKPAAAATQCGGCWCQCFGFEKFDVLECGLEWSGVAWTYPL